MTGSSTWLPIHPEDIERIDQLASQDGWLFGTVDDEGGERFFISKRDESDVFETDADAVKYVTKLAGMGRIWHRMAVEAHGKTPKEVLGLIDAKVTLDIAYLLPKGMDPSEISRLLEENIQHMIGSGGLTGHTEALADSYNVTVKVEGV
jgi:hypothetical protein